MLLGAGRSILVACGCKSLGFPFSAHTPTLLTLNTQTASNHSILKGIMIDRPRKRLEKRKQNLVPFPQVAEHPPHPPQPPHLPLLLAAKDMN